MLVLFTKYLHAKKAKPAALVVALPARGFKGPDGRIL